MVNEIAFTFWCGVQILIAILAMLFLIVFTVLLILNSGGENVKKRG